MDSKTVFRVVAAFDTETCNVGDKAFPILFIFNDFRDVDLRDYVCGCEGERVSFDRYADAFVKRLYDLMLWGLDAGVVPIVAAYNLMFDLTSVLPLLASKFDFSCSAQSSTNVYSLDVWAKGVDRDSKGSRPLLRFWDTYFLEQNGLAAMGETAGLPKAVGDWDYSLVRTPETPLTELELGYAKRDVQVIPAYLAYLLKANDWMSCEELGVRVVTKTSVVRRFAAETFGGVVVGRTAKGRDVTMLRRFTQKCVAELPKDYFTYALRKACFRGGWTFTAGDSAMNTMRNVASLDVTSMHHTFINGMRVPYGFKRSSSFALNMFADYVVSRETVDVLRDYVQPFRCAFHAVVEFSNIEPKAGSVFERDGIWLAPRGKFATVGELGEWVRSEADTDADVAIRERGFHDVAVNPVFAFGKLVRAERVRMFLNEIELWVMSRVYDWDSMRVLDGESTISFEAPPDYVVLQSQLLFNRKNDCKRINKLYKGTPFEGEIPSSIPEGLAEGLRAGSIAPEFFAAYYQSTVKGAFNAIYGTQAQDVFKPDYLVECGEIHVGDCVSPDNFSERLKANKDCKVLYTYGMRIVARSRMHLCIALELLDARFGETVVPTGGDTDSIKCSCDENVSDEMLRECLRPLADASAKAIASACSFVWERFPQFASTLDGVGSFDIEDCGGSTRYDFHMELWNKARVSMSNGVFHVTCAGLSRPIGRYHIENVLNDMYRTHGDFDSVVSTVLGYNVVVSPEISFSLQHRRPSFGERFVADVVDYRGVACHVDVFAGIALFGDTRALGDVSKQTNRENVAYMVSRGTDLVLEQREVILDEGVPVVCAGMFGDVVLKG